MSALCCRSTQPYRPTRTDHEAKFQSFLVWLAGAGVSSSPASEGDLAQLEVDDSAFVIQWVSQVNFGPILSKRYFLSLPSSRSTSPASPVQSFIEVPESFLITHNFSKLNTYKNFRCVQHNRFFELNVYMRDASNKHHWRADVARPAEEIDLCVQ